MGGSSSKPPPPPDYAEQYRKGITVDAQTLSSRRELEFAAARGETGTTWMDGKPVTYNFAGRGDADFARIRADADNVSATSTAQNMLSLQQRFGGEFINESRKQLQLSDPIGFALREAVGARMKANFELGGNASDGDRRAVRQAVLGSQTRSGNAFGVAAGVDEALAQVDFARNLERTRTSDTLAFLSGNQPMAQVGQLRNATVGSAPFLPSQFGQPMTQQNPNAGNAAAGFAQNSYSIQSQNYATNANRPNPWMQAAGIVVGAVATYFTGGLAASAITAGHGAARTASQPGYGGESSDI